MTPLQRGLLVWAIFVGIFFLVIAFVAMQGNRIVERVDTISRYEQAKEHHEQGFVDETIDRCADVLRLYPNHLEARTLLIESLMERGRYREARERAEKGAELLEGMERHRMLMLAARVALWSADYAGVRDYVDRSRAVAPKSAEAAYLLAEVDEQTGDFAAMAGHYQEANALNGRASSPGFSERQEARRIRAAQLKRQLGAEDGSPERRYQLAMAYKEAGEWAKFVSAMHELEEVESAPADAVFWLGVLSESEGDPKRAAGYYNEALARLAAHRQAAVALARLKEPAP